MQLTPPSPDPRGGSPAAPHRATDNTRSPSVRSATGGSPARASVLGLSRPAARRSGPAGSTQVTFVHPATFTRWEEGQGRGDEAFGLTEELMNSKATMLRETVEAFADLRTLLDGLTEEQTSRIRLGVLGMRDLL